MDYDAAQVCTSEPVLVYNCNPYLPLTTQVTVYDSY